MIGTRAARDRAHERARQRRLQEGADLVLALRAMTAEYEHELRRRNQWGGPVPFGAACASSQA
jgi:hypothetical protein